MEISWKGTGSAKFRANHPKLYGNCAFPQNFLTTKLGEITVRYCGTVTVNTQDEVLHVAITLGRMLTYYTISLNQFWNKPNGKPFTLTTGQKMKFSIKDFFSKCGQMLGSVLDTPLVNLPNIFWLLQLEFSVNQQRWMQIFLIVYKGHTEISK